MKAEFRAHVLNQFLPTRKFSVDLTLIGYLPENFLVSEDIKIAGLWLV